MPSPIVSIFEDKDQTVLPPRNRYHIAHVPDEGVQLISEEEDNRQDPRLVIAALFRGLLFINTGREFYTNVPKVVYNDFSQRANSWRTYVENGGWKSLPQPDQLTARTAASSIQQEYEILYETGKEDRCMFLLEMISCHLREAMALESFFFSIVDN